jgi:bromodomain-containing protein 7/9
MPASVPQDESQIRQIDDEESLTTTRMPVMLPLDAISVLCTGNDPGSQSGLLAAMKSSSANTASIGTDIIGKKRLKHWTLNRNPTNRIRTKDTEDNHDLTPAASSRPSKRQRIAEVSDYGPFALLSGSLAKESKITLSEIENSFGTHAEFLEGLRRSLNPPNLSDVHGTPRATTGATLAQSNGLETSSPLDVSLRNALDGEDYVKEVVYGGVDGYAYVRSIAEFLGTVNGDDVCA